MKQTIVKMHVIEPIKTVDMLLKLLTMGHLILVLTSGLSRTVGGVIGEKMATLESGEVT